MGLGLRPNAIVEVLRDAAAHSLGAVSIYRADGDVHTIDGKVSRWHDLQGAFDLSQDTAAHRLAFESDWGDGKPALVGNADGWLSCASQIDWGADFTVVLLCTAATGTNVAFCAYLASQALAKSMVATALVDRRFDVLAKNDAASSQEFGSGALDASLWRIIVLRRTGNTLKVNDGTTNDSNASLSGALTTDTFVLGAFNAAGLLPWVGAFRELQIYNSYKSDAALLSIFAEMRTRWTFYHQESVAGAIVLPNFTVAVTMTDQVPENIVGSFSLPNFTVAGTMTDQVPEDITGAIVLPNFIVAAAMTDYTPGPLLFSGTAWYKGDASSDITVISGKISAWADHISGNPYPLSQATAGNRPGYTADYGDGAMAMDGQATPGWLTGSILSNINNGDFTVIVLARPHADSEPWSMVDSTQSIKQRTWCRAGVAGNVDASVYNGTTEYDITKASTADAWHVLTIRRTGTTLKVRSDGGADGSVAITGSCTTDTFVLGALKADGTGVFNGQIREIQIYNSYLSDANVAICRTELQQRYPSVP